MSIYDIEEPVAADERPTLTNHSARSSGSNFDKILREQRARMTPEQRAQADAAAEERRALEAATKPIASEWVWEGGVSFGAREVTRRETREIGIRIETKGSDELLRFVKGPSGWEAYTLDADFAALAVRPNWQGSERMLIHGGRGGDPSCSVATADVVAFLDAERPLLMAAARGLPAVRPEQTPLSREALVATLETAFSTRRAELKQAQLSQSDNVAHQGQYIAGQVDGLQWMLEMLPGTPDSQMSKLYTDQLARTRDIEQRPFPMDHDEGRAYLAGLSDVVHWGQILMAGDSRNTRTATTEAKQAQSALMAPMVLGSAADTDRMRPSLRLAQVWVRTTEPLPGRADMIITATWGKDHDSVAGHTVSKMEQAEKAMAAQTKAARAAGIAFEPEAGSRLDNELLKPLQALAASTNRTILAALGDKPLAALPGVMVKPDGSITIAKASVQDPANRIRPAEDTVPGYPVTTLAAMEQTLKGPTRSERLDVAIVTQGRTPAYDRTSYERLPDEHDARMRHDDARYEVNGQKHLEPTLRPTRVLDLTRNSPFNTPTRVDRVAFLEEGRGRPTWTTPMAIDQAGMLCNHIRNELKTNPEYAIALAKLDPEVVVADSRAEAFVMAAAIDAVKPHRSQVIAAPTHMIGAFDPERPAQVYVGDPKELQDAIHKAIVRQFDVSIDDLSKTLRLPIQEDESGLTPDGDIRSRRYQTSTPPAISHPQARFAAIDLAILAEDAQGSQHTVHFIREGLSVKAQLEGTGIAVKAEAAFGTALLRHPEGVIAQASMNDVRRAAARPGDSITLDLAVPAQEWGQQLSGLKRAAQR